jgi:hypothetical protein
MYGGEYGVLRGVPRVCLDNLRVGIMFLCIYISVRIESSFELC